MNKEQEKVIYQNMDKEVLIEIVLNFKETSMSLLEENAELRAKLENAIVPKFIYRIVYNKDSNDFNNAKELKIVKYKVFAYDSSENKYWVETSGFKGKYWVKSNIYATREEAEKALKEQR